MVKINYWWINLQIPTQISPQSPTLPRIEKFWAVLSLAEQERAESFRLPGLRERFIWGRVALRQILGHYLAEPPENIQFVYNPYGKPEVPGIAFNFSHTKDRALCAVIAERSPSKIGVDLEMGDRLQSPLKLAQRFFQPAEYQQLLQTPPPQQKDLFLQFWTAKEAYLKALGTGLQGGLDSIQLGLQPKPHLVGFTQNLEQWSLQLWQPQPDCWAAIAVDFLDCEFIDQGEWELGDP